MQYIIPLVSCLTLILITLVRFSDFNCDPAIRCVFLSIFYVMSICLFATKAEHTKKQASISITLHSFMKS